MFYILFTSFNYLHFQINFFPVSTLPAFLCCTPYSIRSGHKAELLLFSSLAMENTRSHNILTDYSPAELQSQAGASCTTAISRYLTAEQEVRTVVSSASIESKTMRHLFQAHAARQKQLHSSHHSSEEEPTRWMFFHFPQWVHKMLIRIILLIIAEIHTISMLYPKSSSSGV